MEITRPTLLVDKNKCLANIKKMVLKSNYSKATLRPHFKTHHSSEIASWFRELGVEKCTVSSAQMAAYFASHGWSDITIAFPYNPLEYSLVNDIARDNTLNILIESVESLEHAKENLTGNIGYYIKVDVGTHRTGVDPRDEAMLQQLVSGGSDDLAFNGFLAHAGHTYGAHDSNDIKWIFEGAEKILSDLKEKYGGVISYGDTPSCSILEDFSSFDELRPGNFVFYDWMQHEIGSCKLKDIAVCVACPIVALHPERSEIVIYGGAVHFSKESVVEGKVRCYGKAVNLKNGGWSDQIWGSLDRISQEHGVIKVSSEIISKFHIGDLIGVIPVHSCLTADLQGHYLSTEGNRIDKIIKD